MQPELVHKPTPPNTDSQRMERTIVPTPAAATPLNWLRLRIAYWTNRLKERKWRRMFAQFGRGSRIGKRFSCHQPHLIAIGDRVAIWHDARIEVVAGEGIVLRIGSNSVISSYSRIAAAWSISIGEGVGIAPSVLVTDHNHDFRDLTAPWTASNTVVANPVEICDGAFIGEGAKIMPGVRIGRHAVIGANSVVTKDVPDYHIAAGVPARLLSRFDPATKSWHRL